MVRVAVILLIRRRRAPVGGSSVPVVDFSDSTGIITVNDGALAYVRIEDAAGGTGSEYTTGNLTAGDNLTLYAAGYDANGNYIADTTVNWSTTGSLDEQTSTGTSSFTFNSSTAPTSGTIEADYVGAGVDDDATGEITVSVGALNYLKIRTAANNGGEEFGNSTISTDDAVTFYAAGYDDEDNYIRDVGADWSLGGSLSGSGGTGTSFTYAPDVSGRSGAIAADTTGVTGDITGTITVIDGALAYVRIVDAAGGAGSEYTTGSLTAGDNLTLYAAGYDADDNYIADQSVDWSTTGTLDDTTATGASFTFNSHTAPASGTIEAGNAFLGVDDATGEITVSVGVLNSITIRTAANNDGIEFSDSTLSTDNAVTLYAAGYDDENNYRGAQSVTWSNGFGDLDAVSGTGNSYTFNPTTSGTSGRIIGTGGGFSDSTGVITVDDGELAYVLIRTASDGGGEEFADSILTADESLVVYAAGYDANDNFIDNESVTWSETGSLDNVSASGTSYTFNPSTAPTTGTLVATHAIQGVTGDATGTITVNVGALASVLLRTASGGEGVEFADSTITVDESVVIYAAGYDGDNNYRGAQSVTWSNGFGDLDAVSGMGSSYTFNPTTSGTSGRIIGTGGGFSDSTGVITVDDGELAYVLIRTASDGGGEEFADSILTADESLVVYAAGYDANDNFIDNESVTWSETGTLDNVSASGTSYTFNPSTAPTTGTLVATHATQGVTGDATGTITVNVGALASVLLRTASGGEGVEFADSTITVDESVVIYAAGYDGDNNYRGAQSVTWSNGFGDLDAVSGMGSSYTFNPTTSGTSGRIIGTGGGFSDSTGVITVNDGNLSRIVIQTVAGDGGAEFGSLIDSAGNSITLYAEGYDVEDNHIGSQDVIWELDGDSIGFFDTSSGTSNTLNFRVVNKAQVKITQGLLTDYSGIVTIRHGQPDSVIRITPQLVSGIANTEVSDSLIVLVIDAYGNRVANTEVDWSTPFDGQLNPGLNDITDSQGLARSKWTLKNSTVGRDTAYASVPDIPAQVLFEANVTQSEANALTYVSGNGQTDTVANTLASLLIVQVVDSVSNPVVGAGVTFAVNQSPSGGGDFKFVNNDSSVFSTLTAADGTAQAQFQLGSKTGVYKVYAINSQLSGSPIIFTATATPDVADSIIIVSGNGRTGTVGQALVDEPTVRVIDAFENAIENVEIVWTTPTGSNGFATPATSYTTATGDTSTVWTLRTDTGQDTLYATSGALTPALFTATAQPDVANTLILG